MENFIPKRAFTLLEPKPNEEIYEICITLKNKQGALAETASALSNAQIDIRTSTLFEATDKSDLGYWTSFINISKAKTSIEQIEAELRKLEVVEDVKIAKPEPLPYDVIHFPMTHGQSAAIVMPSELMSSLFDQVEKILMPSGFIAVFYDAGKKSGAFIVELLAKRYGLSGESLVKALIQASKALGWGVVEDAKLDVSRPFCKVKIRYCFEAIMKGLRKDKACHWTRGFLAGALSRIVGKPMEAIEVKCAAVGDECCEFEMGIKVIE